MFAMGRFSPLFFEFKCQLSRKQTLKSKSQASRIGQEQTPNADRNISEGNVPSSFPSAFN